MSMLSLRIKCTAMALLLTSAAAAQTGPSYSIGPAPIAAGPAPWPSAEMFAGVNFQNHFYGGWIGGNFALNETRNVWADGFILRLEGGAGHGSNRSSMLVGQRADITYENAAVMLGYRKVFGNTTLTGYVGAAIEHNDNSDPFGALRGTQVGGRVLAEVYSRLSSFQDVYAQASFSGPFEKWNVLIRPGFQILPNVWIGPEGQAYGNKGNAFNRAYSEGRAGAFVQFQFDGRPLSSILLSGGYRTPLVRNDSNTGYYVQLGTYFRF